MDSYLKKPVTIEYGEGETTTCTVKDIVNLGKALSSLPKGAGAVDAVQLMHETVRATLGGFALRDEEHPATAITFVETARLVQIYVKLGITGSGPVNKLWKESGLPSPFKVRRIILPSAGYPAGYCSAMDTVLDKIVDALGLNCTYEPWMELDERRDRDAIATLQYAWRDAISDATPRDAGALIARLEDAGYAVMDCTRFGKVFVLEDDRKSFKGEPIIDVPEDFDGWVELCARLKVSDEVINARDSEDEGETLLARIPDKVERRGDGLLLKPDVPMWDVECTIDADDIDDAKDDLLDLCESHDLMDDDIYQYFAVKAGDWLKDAGEIVFEFNSLTIWGRQCCGQAVKLDNVIGSIGVQREILPGMAYSWFDPDEHMRARLIAALIKDLRRNKENDDE